VVQGDIHFLNSKLAKSIRLAVVVGVASTTMVVSNIAMAQSADDSANIEKNIGYWFAHSSTRSCIY
jgi:hypothetical protein